MPSPTDTAPHGRSAAPCRCIQRWFPHPVEHHRALRSAEHIVPHDGSTELLCAPRPVAAPGLIFRHCPHRLPCAGPLTAASTNDGPFTHGSQQTNNDCPFLNISPFPPTTVRDTPTGNVDNSFELSTYQHPPCGKLRFFYPQRVDSFVDNRWIAENNFFVNLEPPYRATRSPPSSNFRQPSIPRINLAFTTIISSHSALSYKHFHIVFAYLRTRQHKRHTDVPCPPCPMSHARTARYPEKRRPMSPRAIHRSGAYPRKPWPSYTRSPMPQEPWHGIPPVTPHQSAPRAHRNRPHECENAPHPQARRVHVITGVRFRPTSPHRNRTPHEGSDRQSLSS